MKCIKIILLSSILFHNSYTHTAQSRRAAENQSYNPDYLEIVFSTPALFLILQPKFKKQFKIKEKSPVSTFLKGKKIEDIYITDGHMLLFRMLFTQLYGQHHGEALPYSVCPNQPEFSYDAAFFGLPKVIQTFLIKNELITKEPSANSLHEQPPSYEEVLREDSYTFSHARTIGAAAMRTYQAPQTRTESTYRSLRTPSNSQVNLTASLQYALQRNR